MIDNHNIDLLPKKKGEINIDLLSLNGRPFTTYYQYQPIFEDYYLTKLGRRFIIYIKYFSMKFHEKYFKSSYINFMIR